MTYLRFTFFAFLIIGLSQQTVKAQAPVDTITFTTGDKYIGQQKNGLPNGYGKMTWNTGDNYEGNWINGLFSTLSR